LRGWDHDSIDSTIINDRVHHYVFVLPEEGARYSVTATLVWKRPGPGPLKNLDLFLYDARSNLVASSRSTVDNVEHLFVPDFSPGRYDLQVLKRGGIGEFGSESYALAFDFAPAHLAIERQEESVTVAWPINQAGFLLQAAEDLNPPIVWASNAAPVFVTNGVNKVTVPASNPARYFRLLRP
jgi:hypothetical protein